MRTLPALLLFLPLSAAFAACPEPSRDYSAAKARLDASMDRLKGHMKNVQCLMASCDPNHTRAGRCYNSSNGEVIKGFRVIQSKYQELERNEAALERILRRFGAAQAKILEKAPDLSEVNVCSGASDSGIAALTQQKGPVDEVRASLEALQLERKLREELRNLNQTLERDMANLRPRSMQVALFRVQLPCHPQAAPEYGKIRSALEAVLEEYKVLDSYFDAQSCRLGALSQQLSQIRGNCGAAAKAAEGPKEEPVRAAAPPPPERKPERKVEAPPESMERQAAAPLPPPRPASLPAPQEEKHPDNWGTMSRTEWEKNDAYKASIQSPAPRVTSSQTVDSFLAQAQSSGKSDYALRIQAAINDTAMTLNGEGVGTAPSLFQDGVIGSRTKGAIDYYMSDPARRQIFLRNLAAYGIQAQ